MPGESQLVARAANTAAGADVLELAQQRRRLLKYGNSNNNNGKPSSLGTVVVQSVSLVSDPSEILLLSSSPSAMTATAAASAKPVKRRNKKKIGDQENIILSREEADVTAVGTNKKTSPSTPRGAQGEVATEENDDDEGGTDGYIAF